MFTSETVLFTFRNEHVYFRNRLGSIFMAVAQVALAQPEKSHWRFITSVSSDGLWRSLGRIVRSILPEA